VGQAEKRCVTMACAGLETSRVMKGLNTFRDGI